MLTACPNLQYLTTRDLIAPNWMADFLEVKKHSLKYWRMYVDDLSDCCNINSFDFLRFLKAQRPGFTLEIYGGGDCDWYFIELKQFLDLYLAPEFCSLDERMKENCICIYYNDVKHSWYALSVQ
uniref:FBA_2 domain-containing protein n=1 Tax=Panagrellus redivivus TaxID=6233 RepID=A0A7E4ZYA1_PANRE